MRPSHSLCSLASIKHWTLSFTIFFSLVPPHSEPRLLLTISQLTSTGLFPPGDVAYSQSSVLSSYVNTLGNVYMPLHAIPSRFLSYLPIALPPHSCKEFPTHSVSGSTKKTCGLVRIARCHHAKDKESPWFTVNMETDWMVLSSLHGDALGAFCASGDFRNYRRSFIP